jgi:uncharacterized protein
MIIGTIKSLWRYPVKSLLGENLLNLAFDKRGAIDDRLYAISNPQGKFASGKNTRRFRRIDNLFSLSAKKTPAGVSIEFPSGLILYDGDDRMNAELSSVLGQQLSLTREAQIPHFDDGAVHVLLSGTLSNLSEQLPNASIDERRFRPNIVIESSLSDDDLIGKRLKIGDVTLEVTHKSKRCRMITLDQSEILNRPEILKVVSHTHNLLFGTYASVKGAGTITVGESVELLSK